MKILHTSDLHIGKRVNEYSMLEEQKYILNKILEIAESENPNAIILAGDIYDKSVPPAEAVSVFDDFLFGLSKLGKAIFIISGNHDSPERISFASRIMEASKIYLSPVYDGTINPVTLDDGGTKVDFYMLPFIKPSVVRHYAEKDAEAAGDAEAAAKTEEIKTYDDAMRYVIGKMDINKAHRNVLIAHQYVTGAERCESEDSVVGGLENVNASNFDSFDYVALGHLHRPQNCDHHETTIRYSGTPLKYSISEVDDKKSVSIIEINGKEKPVITTLDLKPLHEWHDLKGKFDELKAKKGYEEAYVRITLIDEEEVFDAKRQLQNIYHRLLELRYDNTRTKAGQAAIETPKADKLNPAQLFGELFEKQNGQPLSDEQSEYVNELIVEIFNNNKQ